MTDLLGVPVNIGDKVIYTTGSQGNECMEIGTILDIKSHIGYNNIIYESVILLSSTGRKMTNPRGKHSIVSLNPIKTQHPELFI